MRLQRYLSQSGVAARRKAEALIVAGRVRVNGRPVTELGSTVDPAVDRVTVDGQAAHPQELFYCVLNKPKGTITAVSDPEGRASVMEYLPNLPVAVKPVGRLDFYSEGVLLLTNDGELSAALQSPKSHVEKTYHVKFRGSLRDSHIDAMRRGVRLEDGTVTRPAQVDHLHAKSRHDWFVITLTEGKSRQIHRMAEALGYQVLKLQRVAFAGIDYYGLRVGDARELTQAEVNSLRDQVGLPRTQAAAARGVWRSRREGSDIARRARAREREANAAGSVDRDGVRPPGPPERTVDRTVERTVGRTAQRTADRTVRGTAHRTADRRLARTNTWTSDRTNARTDARRDARSNDRTSVRTRDRRPARERGPSGDLEHPRHRGRSDDRRRTEGRPPDRPRARVGGAPPRRDRPRGEDRGRSGASGRPSSRPGSAGARRPAPRRTRR